MRPIGNTSDRGILRAREGASRFKLNRYEPGEALAGYVEHYWTVRWDLTGQPAFSQTVLSYPNVNLAFERMGDEIFTGVYGVPPTTYTRQLEGEGLVLGVKFRPAGFYPFWRQPMSLLTGKTLGVRDLFGEAPAEAARRVAESDDEEAMARLAERWLLDRMPEPDGNVERISAIVQASIADREMLRVERMAERFGLGVRSLQRLFDRYVGVSPKWVIQRFRLQEAAERMDKGDYPDWLKLSHDLGYYDQAHFIKDFKALIGRSPEEYVRDGAFNRSGS